MSSGALEGSSVEETVAFWKRIDDLQRGFTAAAQAMPKLRERMSGLRQALDRSQSPPDGLDSEMHALEQELHDIDVALNGNPSMNQVGEDQVHGIGTRLFSAMVGTQFSTYGPTPTHRRSMEIAESEFAAARARFNALVTEKLPALEDKLRDAGAPWAPGQPLPSVE